MKIVIAGAGSVGYHLAKLLSLEDQDITIIDNDSDILETVASKLDVLAIKGDATSIKVLRDAEVGSADLFLAVTTSEETNLISAALAKQKGVKQTVARVDNREYLSKEQKSFFAEIGIDKLISPHQLGAQEILRLIKRASLTDIFEFEDGKLSIVGFTVDTSSGLIGKKIADINTGLYGFDYRGVAILRDHSTIIPKRGTIIHKGDHVYLSIRSKQIDKVMPFLGKESKRIRKIMIVGDTPLALRTAELLQDDYSVTIVLDSKKKGKKFLDCLPKCLVVIGNPSNKELLEQEDLNEMDAFIALSPDSEVNILTSLVAEESGIYKTIAKVDNDVYTHISQSIGIDTIINMKLIAANNIFRYVRKGSVEAIATLHGVNAEIIEYVINKEGRITSNSLADLNLPTSSVIAGLIRGNESIIPDGNFKLSVGDKIIVFALPEAIKKVEETFK